MPDNKKPVVVLGNPLGDVNLRSNESGSLTRLEVKDPSKIRFKDADTFEYEGKSYRVNLTDSPEVSHGKDKPGQVRAGQSLNAAQDFIKGIKPGSTVKIGYNPNQKDDTFGRSVGDLFVSDPEATDVRSLSQHLNSSGTSMGGPYMSYEGSNLIKNALSKSTGMFKNSGDDTLISPEHFRNAQNYNLHLANKGVAGKDPFFNNPGRLARVSQSLQTIPIYNGADNSNKVIAKDPKEAADYILGVNSRQESRDSISAGLKKPSSIVPVTPKGGGIVSKPLRNFSEISGSDRVRLGAALTDLTGVVSSFIPGANVVSGVSGIGSTVATAGADFADGDIKGGLKNLAINGTLDALSFLPLAGGAAKIGKIAKALPKILPVIKTAALASGAYAMHSNATRLMSKSPSDYTAKDVQDLVNMLQFAVTAGKGIASASNKFGTKPSKTDRVTDNVSKVEAQTIPGIPTPVKPIVNTAVAGVKDLKNTALNSVGKLKNKVQEGASTSLNAQQNFVKTIGSKANPYTSIIYSKPGKKVVPNMKALPEAPKLRNASNDVVGNETGFVVPGSRPKVNVETPGASRPAGNSLGQITLKAGVNATLAEDKSQEGYFQSKDFGNNYFKRDKSGKNIPVSKEEYLKNKSNTPMKRTGGLMPKKYGTGSAIEGLKGFGINNYTGQTPNYFAPTTNNFTSSLNTTAVPTYRSAERGFVTGQPAQSTGTEISLPSNNIWSNKSIAPKLPTSAVTTPVQTTTAAPVDANIKPNYDKVQMGISAFQLASSLVPTKRTAPLAPVLLNNQIRPIRGMSFGMKTSARNDIANNSRVASRPQSSDMITNLIQRNMVNSNFNKATSDLNVKDAEMYNADTARYFGEKNAQEQYNNGMINSTNQANHAENVQREMSLAAVKGATASSALQNIISNRANAQSNANDIKSQRFGLEMGLSAEARQQKVKGLYDELSRISDPAQRASKQAEIDSIYSSQEPLKRFDNFYGIKKSGGVMTFKKGGGLNFSEKLAIESYKGDRKADLEMKKLSFRYAELASKASANVLKAASQRITSATRTGLSSRLSSGTGRRY